VVRPKLHAAADDSEAQLAIRREYHGSCSKDLDGQAALPGRPYLESTPSTEHVPLTETPRSIGTHKSSQDFQLGGYTFYFSSHVDASHSTSFISSRDREWGVCIAVRTGLAYQSVESHLAQFDARLQHGIVRVPTPQGHLVCYDCAWLSLTALSTVTCNLWL
jgi:hypothetical protein